MAQRATATAHKRKCASDEETAAGLCANGCGFFGAAATGNMCSKCFRDHVAAADGTTPSVFAPAAAASSTAATPEKKTKISVTVESSDAADADAAAVDPAVPAVKPAAAAAAAAAANRSATCRKKVGLMGFRCRCEGTFCSVHRYTDKHACGFDYKTVAREQIAAKNPVVVGDKMVTRI